MLVWSSISQIHQFIIGRPIIMRNTTLRRANAWRSQLELSPKRLEIVWPTGACIPLPRVTSNSHRNFIVHRTSPPDQSRKWGVYYVVGLVLKCYFRASQPSCSMRAFYHKPASLSPRSNEYLYQKTSCVLWKQTMIYPLFLHFQDHIK